jgi:hypothetical protein
MQSRLAAPTEQLLAVIEQLPGAQQVLETTAAATAARQRAAAAGAADWQLLPEAAVALYNSGWASVSNMLHNITNWFWQRLGYSTSRGKASSELSAEEGSSETAAASSAGNTSEAQDRETSQPAAAAEEEAWKQLRFQLPSHLLQQQVFYVLALSQQLLAVQQLLLAARHAQSQLLNASRQGALDEPTAAGSNATVAAGTGSGSSCNAERLPKRRLTVRDVVQAGSNSEVLYDAVAAGLGQLFGSSSSSSGGSSNTRPSRA